MRGLLIGGSSCVGKTTTAVRVCAELQTTHYQTDCILPRTPILRPLDGEADIWDRPAEELYRLLVTAAAAAVPFLLDFIREKSRSDSPWILEDERIHPGLVSIAQREGLARGVFILERSAERLQQTLFERLPRFSELAPSRRATVVAVDRRFNFWLAAEATLLGLACISSQPWSDLHTRILGCAVEEGCPTSA